MTKGLTLSLREKREKTQIHRIIRARGDLTAETTKTQRMMRRLLIIICQQIGKPGRGGYVLRNNLLRSNHKETKYQSRLITSKKIESAIKYLPRKKSPGQDG